MRTNLKQKKVDLKTGRNISVEDLKVGMKIVTRWHKPGAEFDGIDNDEDLELALMAAGQQRLVAKSMKVTGIEECPGKWRTHIHVNKRDCYDIRTFVWVVVE
jgi:hypothetical protein